MQILEFRFFEFATAWRYKQRSLFFRKQCCVEETVRGRCRPAHEPYQGRIHEPYIGNEKMGSGCGERIKYQRHFVAALLSFRPYHLFATLNKQKLVFHTQDKQGCEESELGT